MLPFRFVRVDEYTEIRRHAGVLTRQVRANDLPIDPAVGRLE